MFRTCIIGCVESIASITFWGGVGWGGVGGVGGGGGGGGGVGWGGGLILTHLGDFN